MKTTIQKAKTDKTIFLSMYNYATQAI